MEGMIADNVPFLHHPFDQIRACLNVIAHHEESGFYVVLFQGIQNRGRIAVFIARVEGQIDYLTVRAAAVISVVGLKRLGACIAHRRLAVFLKAQAPVCVGRSGSGDALALRESPNHRHCDENQTAGQGDEQLFFANDQYHTDFHPFPSSRFAFENTLFLWQAAAEYVVAQGRRTRNHEKRAAGKRAYP